MTHTPKPKPVKVEKTLEDKLARSRWCVKHDCPKVQCHPHKPSKVKPRKLLANRKPIQAKPKSERRKIPKSERTLLEAELDKVCSEYVRLRDGECVSCHSKQELTCSHFIKRSNQFLRYDLTYNLNSQCAWCNEAHNHDETAYEAYLTKRHGQGMVETLRKAKQGAHFSWSVVELREMLQRVKDKLSDLKGES